MCADAFDCVRDFGISLQELLQSIALEREITNWFRCTHCGSSALAATETDFANHGPCIAAADRYIVD
jgi:hypothetical protein